MTRAVRVGGREDGGRTGLLGQVKHLASRMRARHESHAVIFVLPGAAGGFSPINPRLYREHSAFRESVDDTGAIVENLLGWNPRAAFRGGKERSSVREIERRNEIVHQGLERIALIDHWRSEGITAQGAIGISLGEVVAPYAVDAMSREDCARLVACVAQGVTGPVSEQRVYVIRATSAEAQTLCFDAPAPVDFLGASSATLSLVIFSESEREVLREYFGDLVANEAASGWRYHTPEMHFARSWVHEQLGAGITLLPGARPIYSSAVGGRLPSRTTFDARTVHWIMGSPSHFADAASAVSRDGFDVAVQIASTPHRIFADVTDAAGGEHQRMRQFLSTDRSAQRDVRRMRRRAVRAADPLPPAVPELDERWWDDARRTHDHEIETVSERFLANLVAGKPFDVVSAFSDQLARHYGADRKALRHLLASSVLAILRDDTLRAVAADRGRPTGATAQVARASLQDASALARHVALVALQTMLRLAPDFAVFQPLDTVQRVNGAIAQLVIAR